MKKVIIKLGLVALAGSIGLHSVQVMAWGAYGHEQVNDGAVRLITKPKLNQQQRTDPKIKEILKAKKPFSQCMKQNHDYLVRLAITPDYEWKKMFAIWKNLPNSQLK